MGHVLILFGCYIRMFVRRRFFGPAHEIQRDRRIGLFVAQRMKSKEIILTHRPFGWVPPIAGMAAGSRQKGFPKVLRTSNPCLNY
jgi:hypothetical protein